MIRKVFKVILYVISAFLFLILCLLTVWWINSPGKTDPITNMNGDTIPGSISVIDTVQIGGLRQFVIIRGADTTKPVMLFVHGGPGGPEIGMMKETNRSIENDF